MEFDGEFLDEEQSGVTRWLTKQFWGNKNFLQRAKETPYAEVSVFLLFIIDALHYSGWLVHSVVDIKMQRFVVDVDALLFLQKLEEERRDLEQNEPQTDRETLEGLVDLVKGLA